MVKQQRDEMLVKQRIHRDQVLQNIKEKEREDQEKLEDNLERIEMRFKSTNDNYQEMLSDRKNKLRTENLGLESKLKNFRQFQFD